MQDKKFDELFRDRFETAEIQPSVNLWSTIEEKLVVKRKRVFPVYWSAAAAIAAAVTVGVLFQKTEKIQSGTTAALTAQPSNRIAITEKDNALSPSATTDRSLPSSKEVYQDHYVSLQHHMEIARRDTDLKTTVEIVADQETGKKDLLAMQPSAVIPHLEYREAKVKQEKVELPKTIAPPVEEVMLATADVAPEAISETDNDEAVNEVKRGESKGIRNMGDLINYVVDKVDKREEKFIQFKTDEDDNSSLIGLNIGMFKFSQKKHK